MRHITVVCSDPALFCLLHAVLGEAQYTVNGSILCPGALDAIRATQPDLVLIEVGLGHAHVGWVLLDEFQADPVLRDMPVVVYSVDWQDLRNHAALLDEYGYRALALPAMIDDIRAVVEAVLASRLRQIRQVWQLHGTASRAAAIVA